MKTTKQGNYSHLQHLIGVTMECLSCDKRGTIEQEDLSGLIVEKTPAHDYFIKYRCSCGKTMTAMIYWDTWQELITKNQNREGSKGIKAVPIPDGEFELYDRETLIEIARQASVDNCGLKRTVDILSREYQDNTKDSMERFARYVSMKHPLLPEEHLLYLVDECFNGND